MKLTGIHIKNFKAIHEMKIDNIENALILVGQNNTGKTTILEAIRAAFGDYRISSEDFDGDCANIEMDVSLEFSIEDLKWLHQNGVVSQYKRYETWLEDFCKKLPSFSLNEEATGGVLQFTFIAHRDVPAEQKEMAYTYISILVLGMFVTLAYNMCANVLRAIGDSLTPLIFLILAAVLNVILDYVCILAFSMGVGGAAVATVISQVVSVVLCVIHIKKHFPILQVERRHFKLKKTEVRTMLSGGLSMGMMSSLVNLGTLILQTGINTLGTSVIVAHTAARKVFEIWGLPVTVLGSTMATYSGQNYGAGKYDRITSGLKAALLLGCGWAVMVMIMAYTIATYLVGFIASTDSAEILYWGTTYLRVDMLFEMVCVWIVILRNTMQGVGDYRTPIFSSFRNKDSRLLFVTCGADQQISVEEFV